MIQAQQKALQLKLKIYFNGVMELVDAKKDESYGELIDRCRRIFKVEDNEIQYRLRLYDANMRVRLAPVSASRQELLMTITSFKNYMCFDLESGPDF